MDMRGNIQEVGKGVYRVWVSGGKDESGKRIRISERVHGKRRDAQKRLTQIRAKMDRGEHVRRSSETFGAFIQRWWPAKRAALSPVYAYNCQHWLDKHILPALGQRPMQRITSGEISALLSKVSSNGRTSVAEHLFRFLRTIFRRAVEMGDIARSPMIGVENPKIPRRELTILSPADWHRVREYVEAHGERWWLPMLLTAVTTGLRRSEIAGLRWSDFDPDLGVINVNRSVHYVEPGKPVISEPKTRGSRRAVALDRGTVDVLLSYREWVKGIADAVGRTLAPDWYIFAPPDGDGKPYRPDSYSQIWQRVRNRVGIRGVRFHDLRHSAATLLLASGIPPHVVSQRLGHSTVGFTLTTYGHVLPTQQTEAAEKLARLLNEQSASASLPAAD